MRRWPRRGPYPGGPPYQSSATLRKQINNQEVEYVDMHLSHVSQTVMSGFFGKVDFAVVEATEITPDGRVYLTTSIGASPTYSNVRTGSSSRSTVIIPSA